MTSTGKFKTWDSSPVLKSASVASSKMEPALLLSSMTLNTIILFMKTMSISNYSNLTYQDSSPLDNYHLRLFFWKNSSKPIPNTGLSSLWLMVMVSFISLTVDMPVILVWYLTYPPLDVRKHFLTSMAFTSRKSKIFWATHLQNSRTLSNSKANLVNNGAQLYSQTQTKTTTYMSVSAQIFLSTPPLISSWNTSRMKPLYQYSRPTEIQERKLNKWGMNTIKMRHLMRWNI